MADEKTPAIADPAPLGLAGFGLTTLILSIVNAGWFGNAAIVPLTSSTLSMSVAYGGLAQFIAGLWAFRRGNTFAGTAFCSYGAFWYSFFLLVQNYLGPMIKGAPDATLGWFTGGNVPTFAANADGLITLGGYVGILTAIAALYGSFADVVNASFRRVVLPVGKPFVAAA